MKKIIEFLKRYYQCIYDFNLFKKYINESTFKAILFLLPLFLIFVFQSYFTSLAIPTEVEDSLVHFYDHAETIKYSDITDESGDYNLNDPVNFAFFDSQVQIPQNKLYDQTFMYNNHSYRLILDTQNTLEITPNSKNDYTDEVKSKIGFGSAKITGYVNKDFILISIDDKVLTNSLSAIKGSEYTTLDIYKFIKKSYVPNLTYFYFSLITVLFLYLMYYVVVLLLSKQSMKRQGYKLTGKRLHRVCLYAMQPGMYIYLLLNILATMIAFNFSFVIPLLSMMVMSYVGSKNLENVKDFVKREERAERKSKKKVRLQD